jgi:hypothetical protein
MMLDFVTEPQQSLFRLTWIPHAAHRAEPRTLR